jgi:hypothetical protein
MSRIDDLLAKQKALADEIEIAKQEEREAVLKDIKEKIKLFNFKTTDFKGVLATRKKRILGEKVVATKRSAK